MEYIIISLSIISFLLLFFLIVYKKRNKNYINEINNLEEEKQKYINNVNEELNNIFKERNESLQEEYIEKKEKLFQEYKDYQDNLKIQLEYFKNATQTAKESLQRELGNYKESQEQQIKNYFKNMYNDRKREIDSEIEKYISDQRAAAENFIQEYKSKQEVAEQEYQEILTILEEYKKKRDIINEINRREEELNNEIDSHRIILTDNNKEDIKFLLSIEDKIYNKELLYKLIWSEYLQKNFNIMLNNIFGSRIPKNVIYCIENYTTHKKYIGKTSAEVSKRWTEHIKSSLNIGGIKKQKIHDALYKHWDEFTFSIIEIVDENSNLSEKEKYWINFYETDKYGYNIKSGG